MKKFTCLLLAILLLCALLAGCDKSESIVTHGMTAVLDTTEYVLYQNIFFNDQAKSYDGKTVTKKGNFTVLQDAYNGCTRYYVWGYNDMTLCCDWQWELVPADTTSLPKPGSLVEVTGTFVGNDNALDNYWIENASVALVQEYSGSGCDVDMTTMGGTLERVQIMNMQMFPVQFAGQSVCAYGRIDSLSSFQHPYYDNSFNQPFITSDPVPAIGVDVVVSGTWNANGTIADASVAEIKD